MNKKSLLLSFVFLLTIFLYTLIYLYTSADKDKRIDNILMNHVDTLEKNYAIFLDFFKTTSVSTVNFIQNDKELQYLFNDFIKVDEEIRIQYRQKIYDKLYQHYETMKSYGVLQFHFVLPDNVT